MDKKTLREKILTGLPVILLISFTLCIFGPLELYFTNINERQFWFGLDILIPIVLVVFVCASIFLFLSVWLIPWRLIDYYFALLIGGGLGLYLQGNFLNPDYGIFDGKAINWTQYHSWGIINTLIWGLVLLAPFLLLRFKKHIFNNMLLILPVMIMLIETVTIAFLLLTTDISKKIHTAKAFSLTQERMFHLSQEKNILIIILDMFPAKVFQDILVNCPEKKKLFQDFKFFPDTLAAYPLTDGALPQILTGEWYDNSVQYKKFIESAYNKTPLYLMLKHNGYDTGLYTDKLYVDASIKDYLINGSYTQSYLKSHYSLAKKMYRVVCYKYVPHFLKPKLWRSRIDFLVLQETSQKNLYTWENLEFYNSMTDYGLKNDNLRKAFRLYHLEGAHVPYNHDRDLNNIKNVVWNYNGLYEKSMGALKIVETFIEMLKKKNLYDNTAIFVMGDHGYDTEAYNADYSDDPGREFLLRCNPLLLIKLPSEHHEFRIYQTEVSYKDIHSFFCNLAEEGKISDSEKYFVSRKIKTRGGKNLRYYRSYNYNGTVDANGYLPNMTEYVADGPAYLKESLCKTGLIFTPNK